MQLQYYEVPKAAVTPPLYKEATNLQENIQPLLLKKASRGHQGTAERAE